MHCIGSAHATHPVVSVAQVRMLLANQAALEVDAAVRGHAPIGSFASKRVTVACLCNARGQFFVRGQCEARGSAA